MHIETDGLVIREQNVGESDRLITILTGKYGLVRAFVNGAKTIKNKNLAGTQLLAYSDFVLYQGKDAYTVNHASEKEIFFELRSDIDNLSLAFYLAELFSELAPESAECEELLRLLLNSIYLLSKKKCDSLIVKSVAELRSLSISGYMPDLVACQECGTFESDMFYFSIRNGSLCCRSCAGGSGAGEDGSSTDDMHVSLCSGLPSGMPSSSKEFKSLGIDLSRMPLSYSTVTAMRHIIYSEPKKVFDFTLQPNALADLSSVTERFALEKTGRTYSTLDFYKSLSIFKSDT